MTIWLELKQEISIQVKHVILTVKLFAVCDHKSHMNTKTHTLTQEKEKKVRKKIIIAHCTTKSIIILRNDHLCHYNIWRTWELRTEMLARQRACWAAQETAEKCLWKERWQECLQRAHIGPRIQFCWVFKYYSQDDNFTKNFEAMEGIEDTKGPEGTMKVLKSLKVSKAMQV